MSPAAPQRATPRAGGPYVLLCRGEKVGDAVQLKNVRVAAGFSSPWQRLLRAPRGWQADRDPEGKGKPQQPPDPAPPPHRQRLRPLNMPVLASRWVSAPARNESAAP